MNHNLTLIKLYYGSIWNNKDKNLINLILHKKLKFRGSLGNKKASPNGFVKYLNSIHRSLSNYKCSIISHVDQGDHICVKILFSGIHSGSFRGYSPTGKTIAWTGIGHFSFKNKKIKNIWVLSDVEELDKQLKKNQSHNQNSIKI